MPVVALKDMPAGNASVSTNVGFGKPVAVTAKLPAVPTVKVAAAPLVMAGVSSIVSVKSCVAIVPTPLAAVSVMS